MSAPASMPSAASPSDTKSAAEYKKQHALGSLPLLAYDRTHRIKPAATPLGQ
ncbi:hypothetical protein [Verrucomicrobium spinosum]|uniref:hypothetical protein n=1 Tax=Verrucomicrobium spinosum TaxID=2736 RepID=UPI00031C415E|nr:hypothetical protein [Verrucomicrobium spinosum]